MTDHDSPLRQLPLAFRDERGAIQPLVDETMQSCLIITSSKGSVRANHYHKTDAHHCYVLSGRIEYYARPVGSTDAPQRTTVGPGEMVYTPPMVEHAMVFPEETVFLTMGRNSRLPEVYEEDVVRVPSLVPASTDTEDA